MKPYYADESVTLYHGDCREVTAWLEADVLVTDPPYGMAYASGWPASWPRSVANDATAEVRDAIIAAWGARPALVFGTWRVPKPMGVAQTLIWDKGDDPGMGDLSFPWGSFWEEVYAFGSGFTGKRQNGILRGWRCPKSGRDHPTPKPLGLMGHLIDRCPPGTIADPFAGSGSTLVAAKQLGRHAIGVELEERYCEVIARRLSQGVLDFGEAAE